MSGQQATAIDAQQLLEQSEDDLAKLGFVTLVQLQARVASVIADRQAARARLRRAVWQYRRKPERVS